MATGLKMLLEMWGFDVTLAHDGLAAVAAIRDVRPKAALVDLLMPRLDGLEVARRVRADASARTVFLVAMTGLAGPNDRIADRFVGLRRAPGQAHRHPGAARAAAGRLTPVTAYWRNLDGDETGRGGC